MDRPVLRPVAILSAVPRNETHVGRDRRTLPSLSRPSGCGYHSRHDEMAVEAGSTDVGKSVGAAVVLVQVGESVIQLRPTWNGCAAPLLA